MGSNSNPLDVLKNRNDFLDLRSKSKKFVINEFTMVVFKPNQLGKLCFGLTVPRKVGKAVLRNKLKRWCRYYFQNLQMDSSTFSGYNCNVIFRPSKKHKLSSFPYQQFKADMDRFWQHIEST
ncbi:MAG: ribonuclease P protein component [Bdellovibrionales bacterium]